MFRGLRASTVAIIVRFGSLDKTYSDSILLERKILERSKNNN
jgi:hypothetical protein